MESKFLSLLGLSIFHLRPSSRPSLQPSWFSIYPKATTTYSVIHGKCCRSRVRIGIAFIALCIPSLDENPLFDHNAGVAGGRSSSARRIHIH